ncbi:hypothetical protein ACWELJ_31265 [Nocardia sp. NPDC004582]
MVVVTGLSGESYDVDGEPFHAAGARSVQYLCRDPRGQQRLYKLYRNPVTAPDAIEWARQAMLFGRQTGLAAAAGSAAEAVNWPIDLVQHDAALIGAILPLIPRDYLQPDGRPRTLDQLWAAPGQTTPYLRAGLAVRLCEIVRVLEERQLIHGDLAAENVLWQPAAPLVYLIDTAGLLPADRAHDRFKDRYDLAALLYRTLLPDSAGPPGAPWQPGGVPADLDPRVRALFDRAFGNGGFGPDARPSAQEWGDTLRAVYLTQAGFGTSAASLPPTPTSPTGWSAPHPLVTYHGAPQPDSTNTALKVILGVLLVVLVIAIGVGVVVLSGDDKTGNTATGSSTTTTAPPTTTAPTTTTAVPTASGTPELDKTTLNQQGTDKTPFTADALLPSSFTDSKGVVFTRRSSGVKDCIASNMSQNVKTALQDNKCVQMVTGTYIDKSDKLMTSLEVFAFPSSTEAEAIYTSLKGQKQIWDVWCPTQGVGSSVCQSDLDTLWAATHSSWSRWQYRYLYEAYSLSIDLKVDASLEPSLDAPSRTILQLAGPDNYWKPR